MSLGEGGRGAHSGGPLQYISVDRQKQDSENLLCTVSNKHCPVKRGEKNECPGNVNWNRHPFVDSLSHRE